MERFRSTSRSYAELEPIITKYREQQKVAADLAGARELLTSSDDAEMRGLAADEVKELEQQVSRIEAELHVMLLPSDPNDEKNIILEIRAGAGGDEASLFASELFRMYTRFAERQRWKVKTTDLSESGVGGVKEVIAVIEGDGVYNRLKFESGVHRVQRVPETEAQGRIHTSAVTVAVLAPAAKLTLPQSVNAANATAAKANREKPRGDASANRFILLFIFSTLQPWYFFSVSVGFGAFYGPTFSAIGAFQVFIFFRSGW